MEHIKTRLLDAGNHDVIRIEINTRHKTNPGAMMIIMSPMELIEEDCYKPAESATVFLTPDRIDIMIETLQWAKAQIPKRGT